MWRRVINCVPTLQRMSFESSRRRTSRKFREEIAELKKTGDRNSVRAKEHDLRFELALIDEDEECFYTKRLLKQARRYRSIIIPEKPKFNDERADFEDNEDWSYGPQYNLFLTAKGIQKISEQIRREQKWGQERRAHWMQFGVTLIALIGAMSGWVAFFLK